MPEKIIKNFQKKYGKKKGKEIYYKTANKQGRDPETFEKKEEGEDLDSSEETISKEGSKPYKYDGLNKEVSDMGIFNESYMRSVENKTGIPKQKLEGIWKECVEEQKKLSECQPSSKKFWRLVTNKFETRLDEIALQEARIVMSERDKLRYGIEHFLNNMAQEDYVGAKEHMPKMLDSAWQSLINSRKDYYLKELSKKTQKKAREA